MNILYIKNYLSCTVCISTITKAVKEKKNAVFS